MLSPQEIEAILRQVPFYGPSLDNKDLKMISENLQPNEKIELVISSITYEKFIGVLILADTRLLFVAHGIIWGTKVADFRYIEISSFTNEQGLIWGKLEFLVNGKKVVMDQGSKKGVSVIGDMIRRKLSSPRDESDSQSSSGSLDIETIEKLERLAALHQKGILTDEEFDSQKRRILG